MNPRPVEFLVAVTAALSLLLASAQAQSNGGFESGLTNWIATPAADVVVTGLATQGFPTEGASYARLICDSSGPGIPGHGPHAAGSGSGQVTVLSRNFVRPDGARCSVQIDWDFFLGETRLSAFNDFLSIDVLDDNTNALVANVVFIDNGLLAGAPAYTGVPGAGAGLLSYLPSTGGYSGLAPAPTGLKRGLADISSVAPGTMLRLDVAVGNGSDNAVTPIAIVDNFRVLQGASNTAAASLRVLGSASPEGSQTASDSAGDFRISGPIDLPMQPGQRFAIRTSAAQSGTGFVLLSGNTTNDGSDFGYGDFNLRVADPISVLIDGINPPTLLDGILGTTNTSASFIEGSIPGDLPDGDIGLVAVMEDPSNAPIFLQTTATTRLQIRSGVRIPEGTSEVLTASGASLGVDGFGSVDLTGLNAGTGFPFFGTSYTECFVGANGFITFDAGDTDFTPTREEMYEDEARIAVIWTDFDSTATAGVAIKFDTSEATHVTVSWIDLAEFGTSQPRNRFSVQLFADGTIVKHYDCLTVESGIVGISRGSSAIGFFEPARAEFSDDMVHDGGDAFPLLGLIGIATTPIFEAFGIHASTIDSVSNDIMTIGVNGPAKITYVYRPGEMYRVFCGVR